MFKRICIYEACIKKLPRQPRSNNIQQQWVHSQEEIHMTYVHSQMPTIIRQMKWIKVKSLQASVYFKSWFYITKIIFKKWAIIYSPLLRYPASNPKYVARIGLEPLSGESLCVGLGRYLEVTVNRCAEHGM